jgi:hypothetical protein
VVPDPGCDVPVFVQDDERNLHKHAWYTIASTAADLIFRLGRESGKDCVVLFGDGPAIVDGRPACVGEVVIIFAVEGGSIREVGGP